jgi:hypothetical protein
MISLIIAISLSLFLTLGMTFFFVVMALVMLNGYMSMAAAMPTYIIFNCFVWPFMVGITTLASWVVLRLGKNLQPFWQTLLWNGLLVTSILTAVALFLYFS